MDTVNIVVLALYDVRRYQDIAACMRGRQRRDPEINSG
jgi:hypothetical protein